MTALPAGWTARAAGRPRPDVICLGLSALDHIWTVPTSPGLVGKIRAETFASAGGGMAATAAVTVARLGGRARFWGRAGEDDAGRAMRAGLAQEGVDVVGFRLFEQAESSVSCVLVDTAGERVIVNFRGRNQPDDPSWLEIDDVASAGAVLADPRWPDGAARSFAAAREAGVPTVLDADMAEAHVFERLLPLTDHAIFSAPALEAFTGRDAGHADEPLAKVAAHGCAIAAVTRGEDGVEWLEHGEARRQPAFRVAVADTTGAGDVFHGAWAFAIAAGAPVADAASFAAAAAALKCTRPTGRAGIPTFEETLDLWKRKR